MESLGSTNSMDHVLVEDEHERAGVGIVGAFTVSFGCLRLTIYRSVFSGCGGRRAALDGEDALAQRIPRAVILPLTPT